MYAWVPSSSLSFHFSCAWTVLFVPSNLPHTVQNSRQEVGNLVKHFESPFTLATSVHHIKISGFEPTKALEAALLKCNCAKRNFQCFAKQSKQYVVAFVHTAGGGYAVCKLEIFQLPLYRHIICTRTQICSKTFNYSIILSTPCNYFHKSPKSPP